ncbi:MAG: Gfo/Idh/MocA family oxidoreductase [Clostridia bacterium]|nr:Gfo/Idh/MocA family oxidoreductase [Clostridia bacterium]
MKKVLLVGCGGYGAGYVDMLLEHGDQVDAKLYAIADPYVENSQVKDKIYQAGIPIYQTPEEFYEKDFADIAIISTPIMLHAHQTEVCLMAGSDVLLEKPISGSVADAKRIQEARDKSGRKLVIGFQWSANDAMLQFKKDADAGLYGKLLSTKSLVLWPRDFAYYNRGTRWAGKKYAADGSAIFDSIASNATAHYLFNMLWVAGKGYEAARVGDVSFFAGKANDIETYDTLVLKGKTEDGVELFFGASHAIKREKVQNPIFEYKFEKATAYFGGKGRSEKGLEVIRNDGSIVDYGMSDNGGLAQKVEKAFAYFDGKGENVCPVEAAIKHIELLEGLWEERDAMEPFSAEKVVTLPDMVYVAGLEDTLKECFKEARLPNPEEV